MKKMKKLNLNKVRIVSLKNLKSISGGSMGCTGPVCVQTDTCQNPTSIDPNISCESTGITYGGNDGGTLKSVETPTANCSGLTTCDIVDN